MIYLRGHHLGTLQYFATHNNKIQLEDTKEGIIKTLKEDGHSRKQALYTIQILETALNPDEKIRLIDTLDDICAGCKFRGRRFCRQFVRFEGSAANSDRAYLNFYKLKKRTYTSRFIQRRLKKKGRYR